MVHTFAFPHGATDFVQEGSCRRQGVADLFGQDHLGGAVLVDGGHKVQGQEPFAQRQLCVCHDCPGDS